MRASDELLAEIDARITYDEIGLAHGHFDGQIVKTAFQPMFRLHRAAVFPEAVRGLARPNLMGRPTPPRRLFERRSPPERFLLDCLCRAVHVANLPQLDLDTRCLSLSFNVRSSTELDAAIDALKVQANRLEEEGFDPPRLTCEANVAQIGDLDMLDAIAARIRSAGFRLALAGFGPDESAVRMAERAVPDYVRLDGPWFRTVVKAPKVLPLLASLVSLLHRNGIEVVAEGIETPAQLEAALHIGSDHFEGYWLQPPAGAGEVMTAQPKHLPMLLDRGAKVIPLRRPA